MQNNLAVSATNNDRVADFYLYAPDGKGVLRKASTISKFESQLGAGPVKALLLYVDPVCSLAARLGGPINPEQFIRNWIEEADAHLSVLRRNRRAITVIRLSISPNRAAKDAFRVAFPNQKPPQELSITNDHADSLKNSVAELVMLQNRVASQLIVELQASCVNSVSDSSGPGVNLEMLNQILQKIAARKDEDTHTKSILLRQISQLQSSFETVNAQKINLESEVSALTSELELVYQSTSWRFSAPLRVVKRVLSRRNK